MSDLAAIAQAMVAPNKGILAADESTPTIKKRFDAISLESTEDSRRAYRDMLLTTPALGDHISGVILYDETIRQSASDGTTFVQTLDNAGVIPGIKVDGGAKDLAGFPGEKLTEGLDGLGARCDEYVSLGARFAKWRAVITIADGGLPTGYCIQANAHALARYAAICQAHGLVPMVEPEILMDGDHSIEGCEEVTHETLSTLFRALDLARVDLTGTILKVNMIVSGKGNAVQAGADEIAERTLRVLQATVPPAIPGIAFLSGGQDDVAATVNLDAINRLAAGSAPWRITYSYGRALQAPSIHAWAGQDANREAGQHQLHIRAQANGAASDGSYTSELENV